MPARRVGPGVAHRPFGLVVSLPTKTGPVARPQRSSPRVHPRGFPGVLAVVTSKAYRAGYDHPMQPARSPRFSQVTLNVAELLSWPVIDTTSGTAFGKLAQATPMAGSSAGTVNWMEVSDQAVTAIGAPLRNSWLLPC